MAQETLDFSWNSWYQELYEDWRDQILAEITGEDDDLLGVVSCPGGCGRQVWAGETCPHCRGTWVEVETL